MTRKARFMVIGIALLGFLSFAGVALAQDNPNKGTPDLTDDLGSWAAIVGILLPGIVALLQKATWPSYINAIIFAVACAVAALVYGYIRFGSDFSWTHWQGALLAIITWGVGTYHTFWKGSSGGESLATKLRATGPIK